MLFNSIEFLIFFPITVIIYFISPQRFKNIWLLVASCFFYMYLVPAYITILLVIVLIDYFSGIIISKTCLEKRRLILVISIISNCSILFFFKYINFFNINISWLIHLFGIDISPSVINIILPIGLSFHTFQSMGYVIDVYRGKLKPERNIITYALYVMFFPQLVAGPIERATNLLPQLKTEHKFDLKLASEGLRLILWGMFQKVVIADRLAIIVNGVFSAPKNYDGSVFIVTSCLFLVQIYCDFCGYSDIAIGCARIIGIKLTMNFNSPFASKSVGEFFNRWHISLMNWIKDNIYFPLCKSKLLKRKARLNLLIMFIISGLWHGANWTFVLWGTINGCFIILEKYKNKAFSRLKSKYKVSFSVPNFIRVLITFLLVSFGAIFFRAKNISTAFYIITHLFKWSDLDFSIILQNLNLSVIDLIIDCALIAIIFILHYYLVKKGISYSKIYELPEKLPFWAKWVLYYSLIFGILLLGVFNKNSFIYFQF